MARGASGGALGLLETVGLVAAIEAADAMLKTAEVRLVRQQRTNPALITHVVTGDTAAVQAAVDAGAMAAERVGKVAARLVIPSPDPSVWRLLTGARMDAVLEDAPRVASQGAALEDDYEDRTVRELRSVARDRDDDDFSGRTISKASKDELVAFLRANDRAS